MVDYKEMKILFITEDFYPEFIGGQGVYGYHLVKNLARMGYKVTVLAEKRGKRGEFWQNYKNIKLFLVPFCFGNQLILALTQYLLFKIKLSGQNFDIVHASQFSGLLLVLFKPKNVGKVVVFEWNTYAEKQRITKSFFKKILYVPLIYLEKLLYSQSDGIIFDSPKEVDNFAQYFRVDKPKVGIYLGHDQPKYSLKEQNEARINLRKRLNLPENARIVLYVGRLVERKRVDTLIKALNEIATSSPSARPRNDGGISMYGVIVGDGPERNRLEEMASENVKFVGWTYEVKEYYLASDCFVTVSVAEGGFLITALEAASYGLPLILSPSAAGIPIIKEGENGFIAGPDDYKDLAHKIKRVVGDIRAIREMGERSRKLAGNFSWEKCARETIEFYRFLLTR